jgi:hypothetical protein
MARRRPYTAPQYFAVQFVAAFIPTMIHVVVMLSGQSGKGFDPDEALRSAEMVYIPCAIYLAVLGETVLGQSMPDVWESLVGVVLFTLVVVTMAIGWRMRGDSKPAPDPLLFCLWIFFQIVIILGMLLYAAVEKSRLMRLMRRR